MPSIVAKDKMRHLRQSEWSVNFRSFPFEPLWLVKRAPHGLYFIRKHAIDCGTFHGLRLLCECRHQAKS